MTKLIGLGVVLVVVLIVAGPLISIWALNTLFPTLSIPYSIETYFAMMFVGIWFHARLGSNKD